MKELPKVLGKEFWLKINYLILRFMKSRKAYKITENQPTIFTMKRIENGEVQLHIRFEGKDEWFKDSETIDIDFYVPLLEFKKLKELGGE